MNNIEKIQEEYLKINSEDEMRSFMHDMIDKCIDEIVKNLINEKKRYDCSENCIIYNYNKNIDLIS